jgi:hypothetical protein
MGSVRQPSASDALEAWRTAEREAIKSTTRREAAELAIQAAQLAADAAKETADAAEKAARTARSASDASEMVLKAALTDAEARRDDEQRALTAESDAHEAHRVAAERARQRHEAGP